MITAVGRRDDLNRRRLLTLLGAGLVDSFCLSLAWTVVVLEITRQHGLLAAGLCSTAMLVGVALSAPTATWMAQRLDGRLLRTAGGIEAVLRLGVIGLLAAGARCGCLPSASPRRMWSPGPGTPACAPRSQPSPAAPPASRGTAPSSLPSRHAASLPVRWSRSALVPHRRRPPWPASPPCTSRRWCPRSSLPGAHRCPEPRAGRPAGRESPLTTRRPSRATVLGAVLMMAASGPPLLAVALASELDGRKAVGLAAASFTLGSLFAPVLAGYIERTRRNHPTWWLMLATGMVLGWTLAAQAVVWLCVAQVLSGLCMTSLEGLLDTRATRERPQAVTAALAGATAARALGSAAGTAVLPVVVAGAGLSAATVTLSAVLAGLAVAASIRRGRRRPQPSAAQGTPATTTVSVPAGWST